MQKATEKHTHARKSERSDGVRGIVRKDTPRMTAHMLVNELDSVLYPLPLRRAAVSPNKCSRNGRNHNRNNQNYPQFHREYSKYAAPSWIFDRTRYISADTVEAVGISGLEN